MNEFDVYVKMPDGSKLLEQSGIMAVSAYEAVKTYMRDVQSGRVVRTIHREVEWAA